MPHLIVEYTDNLGDDADIPALLRKANAVLLEQAGEKGGGVFPIGGIRSRAVKLTDYVIADGTRADDAFVHVTLKIGVGRTTAEKQAAGDALFAMITQHFQARFERQGLAISLDIQEFSEAGTWKKNNIHARYKKKEAPAP